MKKLRVFEAFAGYGSQAMALNRAEIDHEVVGISGIDRYAIKAYAAAMRYRVPLEWGIACRTAGILPEAVSGEWIVWLELWIDNNLNF